MIFLLKIVLIICFSWLGGINFAWWSIAVVAFVIDFIFRSNSPWTAFFSGFLAVSLLWFFYAWHIDNQTDAYLSSKITTMFQLRDPLWLIFLTAMMGGLLAGVSSLCGRSFRMLIKTKPKGYYR
ncbi:MAG: hypothetical protein ACFCUU_13525 [Cyclobacteriaceae bacterium]